MYKYKVQESPGCFREATQNRIEECRYCELCGSQLIWMKFDSDIYWQNTSGEKTITTVERLVCKRKKLFLFRCSKYDVFRESTYTIPKTL